MEHQILLKEIETGKVKKRTLSESDSGLFKQPIGMEDDGQILFVVHPLVLQELVERRDIDPKWRTLIKGLDREDNPLIMTVKVE